MRDDNFVVIQGWMRKIGVESLKELTAFAIVYGFSQDGESVFKGSINYIAECMMCDKSTAIRVMKKLEEKGLVDKQQEEINGVKFNRYRVLEGVVAKYHYQWQNATGGSGKMQHNNNIYNNINNNIIPPIDNISTTNNISEDEKLIIEWLKNDKGIRMLQLQRLGLLESPEDFDRVLEEKVVEFYEQCRLDGKSNIRMRGRQDVMSHFNNWIKKKTTIEKFMEDGNDTSNKQSAADRAMQQLLEGLES